MTNGAGVGADGSRGAFSVDSTVPGAARQGFVHAFQRGWDAELGDGLPLRSFNRDVTGDFRVRSRAAKVRDLALTDIHSMSAIRTAHALGGVEDRVRMYVVKRGAWTLEGSRDRDRHTVSAGQFLLRHVGQPWRFEAAPHTTVKILLLLPVPLTPLLGNRAVTGPADSAEVRLLVAHANMVYETMAGLGPAGVQAAHSTLLEVAHGLSVSELAAHWQFADSSHFIRSFKKTYGQTPTEYARSTGLAES